MRVFIVGVTGGVGHRVAEQLLAGGHQVTAIVRNGGRIAGLESLGAAVRITDVVKDSVETLADAMQGSDAILFTAGAGGQDGPEATAAVDGNGPGKVAAAAKMAGVNRFYLVSVFPEAWRERRMDDEFEHYMVEKKKAETQIALTDLDWVILRPSALTDDPGVGTVDIGLAKVHVEIRRDDVAATLVALMQTPGISRVILEVTGGSVPIAKAVSGFREWFGNK
jgi:uncharacterized protein YbjT (DUF2867 family)